MSAVVKLPIPGGEAPPDRFPKRVTWGWVEGAYLPEALTEPVLSEFFSSTFLISPSDFQANGIP